MIAASPGECMVLTGILVDLHVRVVLERRDNQRLRLLWDELILFGNVKQHGRAEAIGLGGVAVDPHAVIGDGGVGVRARGGQKGEQSAQAEADGPDLAGAARILAYVRDRRADVAHAGFDVEGVVQFEGAFPLRFAAVGDVDARFMRQNRSGQMAR